MSFSPFIATPVHDARVHGVYVSGVLSATHTFPGCDWQLVNGTGLMRQRDMLVAAFVAGSCSHLLFVDSDMAWSAADAQKLIDTGKDFVGGTYCRKGPNKPLTAHLLPNREGDLIEATHVGTGFLLVSRAAILRLLEAFKADTYTSAGKTFTALFLQNKDEGTEDLAFCRKWRELGGQVWMHTGVVLPHMDGNTAYVADVSEFRELATAAE
ncbi:mannan polymerase complexes subunit mnN9: gdP.98A [Caudoviricetes sp.]|nr:mannan polymerase complexes subunit mnN9: gdP.98A [Caudoviricetes sp.]